MDIFICEGNESALKSLIDVALNQPTERYFKGKNQRHYELAGTHVGFACIDVKRLLSRPAAEAGSSSLAGLRGVRDIYAHQIEVAVMVQVQDSDGLEYWYLPYVLNSLPTAVVSGREIYGYPKQHAEFTSDGHPDCGPGVLFGPDRKWRWRVGVHAFDITLPVNGQSQFRLKNVLTFRRGQPAPGRQVSVRAEVTPRNHLGDFDFYGVSPALPADDEGANPPVSRSTAVRDSIPHSGDRQAVAESFRQRIRSDVPYLFLRQFREPGRENFASYQALILGLLVPDPADRLDVDTSDFTLVMPWAYNLALAKQLFNRTQKMVMDDRVPDAVEAPVVGVLTGRNTTFNVLPASVVWQFP